MSLNAREAKGGGKTTPPMEPGTYPARLVQVIGLGLQPQEYKGEVKAPLQEIAITHEFLDEFLKDEEGNDLTDKPRWLTETFPLHNLAADRAKSTGRYYALDPEEKHGGDWTSLLGKPEMITVIINEGKGKNKGKQFNNVASTSAMRAKEADKAPKLVNKPVFFDMDNPDIDVFMKLPKFLQDKIKGGLEYGGSKLEELVSNYKPTDEEKKTTAKKTVVVEDDEPEVEDGVNW
jgi:hypothetical protein